MKRLLAGILSVTVIAALMLAIFVTTASAYPTGWSADKSTGRTTDTVFDTDSYGSTLHMAYKSADNNVHYARSINNGLNWTTEYIGGASPSSIQVVAMNQATIYVFWVQGGVINSRRSADGGVSFLGLESYNAGVYSRVLIERPVVNLCVPVVVVGECYCLYR